MKFQASPGVIAAGIVSAALLLLSAPYGFAKEGDLNLELSVGWADGPNSSEVDFELGNTIGGGIGIGYEGEEFVQYRLDLSFFNFSDKKSILLSPPFVPMAADYEIEEELQVIEVFAGFRAFFTPLSAVQLFGEVGLSGNYVSGKATLTDPSFGKVTVSDSDYVVGVVPGVGARVWLTPKWGLGVNARYHYIGDVLNDSIDATFLSVNALVHFNF